MLLTDIGQFTAYVSTPHEEWRPDKRETKLRNIQTFSHKYSQSTVSGMSPKSDLRVRRKSIALLHF